VFPTLAFSLLLPSLLGAQDSTAAGQITRRAFVLAQVGHLDEAIVEARRVIELAPHSAVSYSNLGGFYLQKGEFDAAVSAFRKAIELDPRYRPAYSNLGNAYTDAGQLDSAIALHRRAMALDSTDARRYIDLGTALERNGQLEESIQQFKKAVALDPNNAMAWYDLGVSYYRLKRWPETLHALIAANEIDEFYPGLFQALQLVATEARSAFEQRAINHPEDPTAHYYLAYVYSYQRDWGKALTELDRATELDKGPEIARARAWFESRRGKDEEAIAAARACVPSDWSCYLAVGYSFSHLKRPREALEALLRAASINPRVINVQQNLGVAYLMVGKTEEAATAFERALTLGAQSALVHLNLAVAYRDLGRYDLAWRHARILERMGHANARVLLQDLARRSPEPTW